MKPNNQTGENPFSLSIGDLMAAILFVFVLLLSAAMLKISEQSEKIENIATQYDNSKEEIYKDLEKHFGDDIVDWGAEIDKQKLSIRFSKQTMFDNNDTTLRPEFCAILDDFFPKYINLLMAHKDEIAEIRIEGHTSSIGSYFHNMQLSQDRSRNVLEYCESLVSQTQREWMRQFVTANGLSYSHLIYDNKGFEDENRSRRVEFRILTNSEESMQNILEELDELKK